jgi:hypothetical protein
MQPNRTGIYASQISGHLWAPNGAYDALATTTLGATTASVTFAGIPQGYKHLQMRAIMRGTGTAGTVDYYALTFNGDSGANYSTHRLDGNGSVAYAQSSSSGTSILNFCVPNANTTAGIFGAAIFDILDYASTSKNKTVRVPSGVDTNGGGQVNFDSGAYFSTAAISSISISVPAGSFTTNTQFALYGVK